MLTCHSCIRYCLQSIIGDSVIISPIVRPTLAPKLNRGRFQKSYASTYTAYKPLKERQTIVEEPQQKLSRQEWLDSRGVRPASKLPSKEFRPVEEARVARHLVYLSDPLKLADFIRQTLHKDDFETAESVVRAASKNILCTVSWNHLIDYQLRQGRMKAAMKTYNEMKKRAQAPDAYTYTLLFRGCAEHPEADNALERVITLYQGMFSEKSKVKPNTIHMNAVLKMCAKAQNMDAMFSIVDDFPAKGLRAPNNLSFTTILNAQRMYAVNDLRSTLTPVQMRANRQATILNARKNWQDVTKRWSAGDLIIDEELVCAMGRLLLIGGPEDCDDVLSLIEQTMNIPRVIPRFGTPERARIEPASQGRQSHGAIIVSAEEKSIVLEDERTGVSVDAEAVAPVDEIEEAVPDEQFALTSTPPSEAQKSRPNFAYAKPGQNTLSLILEALTSIGNKQAATKYWDIFTRDLSIVPDGPNYHDYLRILRVARASTETVELLLRMPKQDMAAKTFRIAMATCERDKNNRHAFSNAGKILDIMQTNLREPDIPALLAYLETGIKCTPQSKNIDRVKVEQGTQILRAVSRLRPSLLNLRSIMQFKDPALNSKKTPAKATEFIDDIRKLTQRMVSAYDLLLDKAMVPREEYSNIMKERSKLAAFITRSKLHQATGNSGRSEITSKPSFDKTRPKPRFDKYSRHSDIRDMEE